MRITAGTTAAKPLAHRFFVGHHPRPIEAYHLRLPNPVTWTYARDLQNAIVKAYQSHHHNIPRHALPPTFITLRFQPVFTYGRQREDWPSKRERKMLEGIPDSDGLVAETRMAWHRATGWQFHGPGQVQCWMVVDLEDWSVITHLRMQLMIVGSIRRHTVDEFLAHVNAGLLPAFAIRTDAYEYRTLKL